MGGWSVVLQVVQVYPDLCIGLLQLHAGGLGCGQTQGCYQAINSFRITEQVGKDVLVSKLHILYIV